jgi:hypothetical protein
MRNKSKQKRKSKQKLLGESLESRKQKRNSLGESLEGCSLLYPDAQRQSRWRSNQEEEQALSLLPLSFKAECIPLAIVPIVREGASRGEKDRQKERKESAKPNAFSRRKPATKPQFRQKRKQYCIRKRKSRQKREWRDKQKANEREQWSRMHPIGESLLGSRYSVASETDTASGIERAGRRERLTQIK